MSVTVEVRGLELPGRHGVSDEERGAPQPFVYDVWLQVGDEALTDDVGETVDYREVVKVVREISDGREFHLLEALAGAVADALVDRLGAEHARVRVRKPQVRLELPVEWTAATVERSRR